MAAIPRIVWPYVITSSNDDIQFTVDSTGSGSATYTGTVAQGTYLTPELLGTALCTGIAAATRAGPVAFSADGGGATFALSGAGIVTLTLTGLDNVSGQNFQWGTNAQTQALGTLLGFGTSNTSVTASGNQAVYTAASPITQLWTPVADGASYGVRTDTARTAYVRTVARTSGGQNKTLAFDTLTERTVAFEFLTAARTFQASESSCVSLERFWLSSGVGKFRYSPDRANPATSAVDYFLLEESAHEFEPERMFDGLAVYRITLRMGAYTA